MNSLLARLRLEVPGEVSSEVLRVYCLYFCRLIDSDTTKAWIRATAEPEQVEPLLEMKYSLDDSTRTNSYWRAVHALSDYKRPPKQAVKKAAYDNGVDFDDLHTLIKSLHSGELAFVSRVKPILRGPYTNAEISYVLDQVQGHINGIVYKRLRYVADNDYSRDRADMAAELRAYAVRLIRRYEIEAETYEHMVRLVGRGLSNHGTNLAIRAGRSSRRILNRLVEQPQQKEAWWFDTVSMGIRRVEIPKHKPKDRWLEDDRVCCEVRLRNDGTVVGAQVNYLFTSRREALVARLRHRRGEKSERRRAIDLEADVLDDFVPTTISLSKKVGFDDARNPMTLEDVIPSPVNSDEYVNDFVKALKQNSTQRVREFTECILGRDLFFLDYLREERGMDPATLTERQLGSEACKFLGIRLKDVKDDLKETPTGLWTEEQSRRIYLEA